MQRKTVFITGASAGLGAQMAMEFAQRGYNLALTARSQEKLAALQKQVNETAHVEVRGYRLDVTDAEAVEQILQQARSDFGQLDIVIANAGVSHNLKTGKGDFDETRKLIETNVTGAMATVDAAVRIFKEQGSGQIVGLSSVASIRGLPYSGAYSASKAALATYLESLRLETRRDKGITVTTLLPGYIDTEMNRHMKHRPFLTTLEKGAGDIVSKIIAKRKVSYVPSRPWCFIAPLLRVLPDAVVGRIF